MPLPQTKRILIVTTIISSAVVAALFFLGWQLNEKANELETVVQSVANEMAISKYRESLQNTLASSQAERVEVSSYVVRGNEGTIALLSQIEELASKLGVELTTDKLDVVTPKDAEFSNLNASISFRGSEKATITMIEALENLPFMGHIKQMTIIRTVDPVTKLPITSANVELTFSLADV